jgi:hypothetical protein
MLRFPLALAGSLLILSAAQAQLAIQNIQPGYGPLGPERPDLAYHHLDHVSFRFTVSGARPDEEGIANVHIATQLTAVRSAAQPPPAGWVDGKVVGNSDRGCAALLQFGSSFAEAVCFTLPKLLEPGEYLLTVSVKDDHLKANPVSFERKLILLPEEFAITSPEFYYDGEGQVEAPFGGMVGQKLHFQFNIIGIACSTGKKDVESRFEVLDAKTREPLSKPIVKADQTAMPQLAQSCMRLSSMIPLDRPGDFILRVTATDRLANKTANLEVPIRVSAP